ncbi:hypothetical protein SAMN05421874_10584 [Nonomuraea maritima]|uniref:Sulfite exporter TauE/SafE n=1 Tax=Nonomuraea maritima TaxID=683260 RepID=A0A1G8Z1G0_9ACTN|nr:hypothetical protein [Nonomuraea maritima]SDK08959.1 hypothetical protein SAMN05421874_10584 [Nonomuraea maritima]
MIGALLAGIITGTLGGLASIIPEAVRLWALAPITAVIMLFELAGRPLSLPQNRRLVPQDVIPRADFSGPLQFGFEMGTGVRTFTPTALPQLLVVVVVLAGGLGPGLLAGLGFGVGRTLMPLARALSGDPRQWDTRLLASTAWVGRLCAIGFLLALALHWT